MPPKVAFHPPPQSTTNDVDPLTKSPPLPSQNQNNFFPHFVFPKWTHNRSSQTTTPTRTQLSMQLLKSWPPGLMGFVVHSLTTPRSNLSAPPGKRGHLTCGCLEALHGTGHILPLCPHTEVVQSPRSQDLCHIKSLTGRACLGGLISLGCLLLLGLSPTGPLDPVHVQVRVGVCRGLPPQGD